MKRRKRTNLATTLQVGPSGELWLHAASRMPWVDEDAPEEIKVDGRRYANRLLDELFSDAMTDAMVEYYIPVPPMQQREIAGDGFWNPRQGTVERRIRMVKPMFHEDETLSVRWYLDPAWSEGWTTYIPEYEDDQDERPDPALVRPALQGHQQGDQLPDYRAGD